MVLPVWNRTPTTVVGVQLYCSDVETVGIDCSDPHAAALTECPAVGTAVRIIPGSRYDSDPSSSNPGGIDGNVGDCNGGGCSSIHVDWANGLGNSYHCSDLYLL